MLNCLEIMILLQSNAYVNLDIMKMESAYVLYVKLLLFYVHLAIGKKKINIK